MDKVYSTCSYLLPTCLFYRHSIDLKGKTCASIYTCRYDIAEYTYKHNAH